MELSLKISSRITIPRLSIIVTKIELIFTWNVPGYSQTFGQNFAVARLPEIPRFGEVGRWRHPCRHQVRFRETLPHFSGTNPISNLASFFMAFNCAVIKYHVKYFMNDTKSYTCINDTLRWYLYRKFPSMVNKIW